ARGVRLEAQQGDVEPAELGALDAVVLQAAPGAAGTRRRIVRRALLAGLGALGYQIAQGLLGQDAAGLGQRGVRGRLDGVRRGALRGLRARGLLLFGVAAGGGTGVRGGAADGDEHRRNGGRADEESAKAGAPAVRPALALIVLISLVSLCR